MSTMTHSERPGAVTFKAAPFTLVGDALAVGQSAPDFNLVTNDLAAKTTADYRGKTVVLMTVPSLDTPVCDTQARRFNQEAAGLGANVQVLCVSLDLPFAQKRWCGAAGVEQVETLSDYKDGAFGPAYGLFIKELALLARAVLVLDPEGKITYCQVVKEVTEEPDYDAALQAARAAS